MDSVDRLTKLQNRVQLYGLLMNQPMRIVTTPSAIHGGAPTIKAFCIICEGSKPMQAGEVPTLQDAMDFPHKDNCMYGNLIADLMIATQEPVEL